MEQSIYPAAQGLCLHAVLLHPWFQFIFKSPQVIHVLALAWELWILKPSVPPHQNIARHPYVVLDLLSAPQELRPGSEKSLASLFSLLIKRPIRMS